MKIGIFGGTFNPIHLGHLHIAEQTQREMALDQIMFLPTGDPPHKPPETLAPAPHRLEMVRLALKNHPYFVVSDYEAISPAKSYTIHTLQHLKEELEGELFFMVGLDAFLDIASWKRAEELLKLTNFCRTLQTRSLILGTHQDSLSSASSPNRTTSLGERETRSSRGPHLPNNTINPPSPPPVQYFGISHPPTHGPRP